MSVTYDFIIDLVQQRCPSRCRLLDFGCGAGEVVSKGLSAGFDAWGVDSFADGWQQYADRAASLGDRIKFATEGAPLPFADGWFDVVVTNQVMEHVSRPEPAIDEMARVLRFGGTLIAIFPTREVLIEPHLKVPLVHWLRSGSPAQARALELMHLLGVGRDAKRERAEWVKDSILWMQQHTFYQTQAAAIKGFQKRFRLVAREEAAFMRDRLARSSRLRWLTPIFAPRWIDPVLRTSCVRLANVVLVMQRV